MSDATQKARPGGGTFAALKNVSGFRELVERIITRAPSLPNIGVMHGRSGDGKTYASIYAQNKTRALRVEVGDSWTKKTLLTAILREGGLAQPRGTIPELAEQVVEMLSSEPRRPLFIDEADKIVDRGYAEMIRELAMQSNVPVLLIGEEALPQKLARIERLHNRVLSWFGAEPCDFDDARKLAELLLPAEISDDLLEDIRIQGDGRARRIATSLDGVAQWAKNHGVRAITRENYNGPIYTGEPPKARASRLIVSRSPKSGRAA